MVLDSETGWEFRDRPWVDPNSVVAACPLDLVNAKAHGIIFKPTVYQKRRVQLAVGVPWLQARAFVGGERLRCNTGFVREHVTKGGPGDFFVSGLSATFRHALPLCLHEYGSKLQYFLIYFLYFFIFLFRDRSLHSTK